MKEKRGPENTRTQQPLSLPTEAIHLLCLRASPGSATNKEIRRKLPLRSRIRTPARSLRTPFGFRTALGGQMAPLGQKGLRRTRQQRWGQYLRGYPKAGKTPHPPVLQEHPAHRSRTECRAEPSSVRRPGGRGALQASSHPALPGRPSAPHPGRQRQATAGTPGFPSGPGLRRDNLPLLRRRPLGLHSREASALPAGPEEGAPEAASKLRRSHRPASGQRPSAPPRTAVSAS